MIRLTNRISRRQVLLFAGDFIVLMAAPVISVYLFLLMTFGLSLDLGRYSLRIQPTFMLYNLLLFVLVLYIFEMYNHQQDFRKRDTLILMPVAVVAGGITSNFLTYLLGIPLQGRGIFFLYLGITTLGVIAVRLLYSVIGSSAAYNRRAMILGCGETGRAILEAIGKQRYSGVDVIGFLDRDPEKCACTVGGVCVHHVESNLKDLVRRHEPQLLIVALHREAFSSAIEGLIWCAQNGIEIWDVPTAYEHLEKRVPLKYVDDAWLLSAAVNWPKMQIGKGKRVFDLLVSLILLVISSPIMLISAIAIWFESKRPIMLTQSRIGKNGRIIGIYKFRSMTQSQHGEDEKGTDQGDSRITRVGRIIRKLHIDELPQLVNVLKGDMSIVGPRTELFDFIYEYIGNPLEEESFALEYDRKNTVAKDADVGMVDRAEGMDDTPKNIIPYIEQRFTVHQGITGWAQIMYPYVSSTYDDMVKKLEYDLYYIKNMSLFLDIIILLKTIRAVLLGRGK